MLGKYIQNAAPFIVMAVILIITVYFDVITFRQAVIFFMIVVGAIIIAFIAYKYLLGNKSNK